MYLGAIHGVNQFTPDRAIHREFVSRIHRGIALKLGIPLVLNEACAWGVLGGSALPALDKLYAADRCVG